jgi:hypothetical protein
MRAETKPPGGFVISPEIPAVLGSMAIFRTLCGSSSEKSVKFGLGFENVHGAVGRHLLEITGAEVTVIQFGVDGLKIRVRAGKTGNGDSRRKTGDVPIPVPPAARYCELDETGVFLLRALAWWSHSCGPP